MIGMCQPPLAPPVIAQLQRLFESLGGEIAFLLISVADALLIFFELRGVECLREKLFKEDGVRDADRVQVLHRAHHFALA